MLTGTTEAIQRFNAERRRGERLDAHPVDLHSVIRAADELDDRCETGAQGGCSRAMLAVPRGGSSHLTEEAQVDGSSQRGDVGRFRLQADLQPCTAGRHQRSPACPAESACVGSGGGSLSEKDEDPASRECRDSTSQRASVTVSPMSTGVSPNPRGSRATR